MSATPGGHEPTNSIAGALRRFSPDEYHRMIDLGILTEDDDVELLEGLLVEKMVRKPRHDAAVSLALQAVTAKLPANLFCRVQSAISTDDSEPEPDLAVVKGPPRRYADRHPSAGDIALVVEVAEGSLERDRRDKARLYARAGIRNYWIVNLVDDEVEVCADPSSMGAYARRKTVPRSGTVTLEVDGTTAEIPVAELLP